MNCLEPKNCNTKMCHTCIFQDNGHAVRLSLRRTMEILDYLVNMENTHICHTTDKTCFGALSLQAKVLHAAGKIPEPTVTSLLNTASKALKNETI